MVKNFEPLDYGSCLKYIFCSFYRIDWHLTINYWRGTWLKIDPLDWFSQTNFLLIRRTCSTWFIFSDKLSPYQENLFQMGDFPEQAVYTWGDDCSTWVIFPDKLSPHGEIKDIFNWFLVFISCRFERLKKWLTVPFLVFPSFLGNNQLFLQTNHHYFFCSARVKLVKKLLFQNILLWKNCQKSATMPALDRNEKITCDKCGTQTTKKNIVRHKTRCSAGTLFCTQCPNFSTTSQTDLNYNIAKKHSASGPKNNPTCKECSIEFPSFYSLRHHKQRYYTAETTTSGEKADMQSIADAGDDKSLEEELQSCRQFLVDFEVQKGRHSMFNLVVNNRTAQVLETKLDRFLDNLKCAAKLNLALGFILRNIEDGKIRYFYAHENKTRSDQSKLVSNKDDMAKLKEILKKTDVIESCTKERSYTN